MSESEKKIKKQFYQFSPQRVLKAAAMATLKKPVDLEQPPFFKKHPVNLLDRFRFIAIWKIHYMDTDISL